MAFVPTAHRSPSAAPYAWILHGRSGPFLYRGTNLTSRGDRFLAAPSAPQPRPAAHRKGPSSMRPGATLRARVLRVGTHVRRLVAAALGAVVMLPVMAAGFAAYAVLRLTALAIDPGARDGSGRLRSRNARRPERTRSVAEDVPSSGQEARRNRRPAGMAAAEHPAVAAERARTRRAA
jgi:hypothetical protein